MNLFNLFDNFKDTIFLKTDSSLECELTNLKLIRNDKNKNQIDKDIKLLELGLYGEKQIEYELSNANLGMYVLHDITIMYKDQKAQIDFVVITKGFIYLIECKNLIGNITVSETGEFRRDYEINGKRYKEAIYSPYTQCMRHRDIYEKIWMEKHNNILDKTLYRNSVKNYIKPLVVAANSKGLLNLKYAPKEIKDCTIRADNLVNYIKKDIEQFDKDSYGNKKQMEETANSFLRINVPNEMKLVDKYKINLKEELENFRKEKSKKMNIPAYYVFTNEELEKIIKNKPRNKEELEQIVPNIKVNIHGNEILKIINKYL